MRRNLLVNGALFVVALMLALVVAEAAFRLVERRSLAAPRLDGERIDLGKLDYNDTMVRRTKPAGEFRILSFGDSFCYSIMAPPYSYSGVIAETLEKRLPNRRFRVVNLGEAATTVTDYAAAYAFWSERIEHDAALFNIYLGNDLLDVVYRYTPVQWQPNHAFRKLEYHMIDGSRRSPVPRKFPLRMLDHAYTLYLTTFILDKAVAQTVPDERFNLAAKHNLPDQEFLETNRVQLVNFDFAKINSLAEGYWAVTDFFQYVSKIRKSGVRTIVTLAPNEMQVDRAFRERVAETYGLDLLRYDFTLPSRVVTRIRDQVDPEIDLLDLSPNFVCRSERGQRLYYPSNTHWSPEGNALAGEIIADHLAHYWVEGPSTAAGALCDTAWYYARFAQISETAIVDFVASVAGGKQTAAPELTAGNVVAGLMCGSVDGAVIDELGGVFLWGFAYDPRTITPPGSVFLLHNGKQLPGRIPVVLDRPDVATHFDAPALAASGWNFRIPPEDLVEGENVFNAYALLDDGKYGEIPDEGRTTIFIEKANP